MDKNKTLLFLGDVVPYKPFKFRNNIRTVINLESPITESGLPEGGKINLRVRKNYLDQIFGHNLFCVNIGNNHILDYGYEGLRSTLKELDELNTPYFGLNSTGHLRYDPLVLKLDNLRVAFISAVCSSTSPILEVNNTRLSELDTDFLISEVARLRPEVDRIVVYIHWGREESSYPEPDEIQTARRLVECGIDLVVGSHAHAPQAVERYKNGVIAYNLGNFIMPELKNIPSYYTGDGEPQSVYNKSTMPWNRTSWGLAIDMKSMEFRIRKFYFTKNRILRLAVTPFDCYLTLRGKDIDDRYTDRISRHLKRRDLYRRLVDFVHNPHVPDKLKRMI